MFEIISSFNRAADTYEDWYQEPLGEYVLRAELKGLNALLPDEGVGAEIGAGTGIFAAYLMKEGRSILCVDPAIKMLRRAQRRGLRAILGTAESPPVKPQSLDFVYLVIVMEFLPEPTKALSSIRHLLKPRSPIILLMINKESSWGSTYAEAGRQGDTIFKHANFYTLEEAVNFLEQVKYEFDSALGALLDPPNTIPNGGPSLISLTTQKKSEAGVLFIKGIKN